MLNVNKMFSEVFSRVGGGNLPPQKNLKFPPQSNSQCQVTFQSTVPKLKCRVKVTNGKFDGKCGV